jgi:biotin synthase-like enzyme
VEVKRTCHRNGDGLVCAYRADDRCAYCGRHKEERNGLVTEYGRYDRAAIVDHAKKFKGNGLSWDEAMRRAYVDAKQEREAMEARCRQLGLDQSEGRLTANR